VANSAGFSVPHPVSLSVNVCVCVCMCVLLLPRPSFPRADPFLSLSKPSKHTLTHTSNSQRVALTYLSSEALQNPDFRVVFFRHGPSFVSVQYIQHLSHPFMNAHGWTSLQSVIGSARLVATPDRDLCESTHTGNIM